MYIIDFYYGSSPEDEELHRFLAEPAVYYAVQGMMKSRTKTEVIYGYVKRESEQTLPKKPVETSDKVQDEFKFESAKFSEYLEESGWIEKLSGTEPYRFFSISVRPGIETKIFKAEDRNGHEHQIIVNSKYGDLSDALASVYLQRMPDREIPEILLTEVGFIFEFGTDFQHIILNIFDRITALKIIATVFHILKDFYYKQPEAAWMLFGGYAGERSKMKLYESVSKEIARELNMNRRIFKGTVSDEMYYLLYK